MKDQDGWRPIAGGPVALNDAQLAEIGLMVVFEAHAKASASMALKVVEGLSWKSWIKLERMQFSQIMLRLSKASEGVDTDLEDRVRVLEQSRQKAHELRHVIVHLSWSEGGDDGPTGYDFGRERLLSTTDITNALAGCAELKRAAHWTVFRCAELIEQGRFQEGDKNGGGMNFRTRTGLVRL